MSRRRTAAAVSRKSLGSVSEVSRKGTDGTFHAGVSVVVHRPPHHVCVLALRRGLCRSPSPLGTCLPRPMSTHTPKQDVAVRPPHDGDARPAHIPSRDVAEIGRDVARCTTPAG